MTVNQIIERKPHYKRFPWRADNSFRLLVNADEFIPVMLDVIKQAKKFILFEMYLIDSSRVTTSFIDTVLNAAERGIIFYIILDDFGTRGLHQKDRNKLKHKNINITVYNPLQLSRIRHYFFRDHRKLLLADGEIAITGSAGLTAENDPSNSADKNWRDTMLIIKGPVVNDWLRLFEGLWNRSSPDHLRLPDCPTIEQASAMYGRVIDSRPMRANIINRSVVRHGLLAERTIWFVTAYFHPPWSIRRMLRKKARQNLDVRILLPGPKSDHPSVWYLGHRHYSRLLHAGVRIFEYQPQFMHSKMVVCDEWCTIGSSNFDRWELPRNLEANQEIVDHEFITEIKAMLEKDFSNSVEIVYEDWNKRSWIRRIKEWFWNQVGRFFDVKKH